MKINNKNGLKFVLLALMMLTMVFYGCADDGGGSGLTGIDAEAAGFASTGGITLPASIENADTIPADDIDMRSSTGDSTTNEEWFTDQNSVNTSITLPDSVAKSMAKYTPEDITNYTVEAFLLNQNGATNIEFSWVSNTYNPPTFSTNLPVDGDTSYFCFVLKKNNVVTYRSHFRKISKVYGVTDFSGMVESSVYVGWTNPTNDYFGGCKVFYGTNGVADQFYIETYNTNTTEYVDLTSFVPSMSPLIIRVVVYDTNGAPYSATAINGFTM